MQQPVPVELYQWQTLVLIVWILSIIFTIAVAELKHRTGWLWGIVAVVFGPMAFLAVGMSPYTSEFDDLDDMCEKCGRLKKSYHSEARLRNEDGLVRAERFCTGPASAYQMQRLLEAMDALQLLQPTIQIQQAPSTICPDCGRANSPKADNCAYCGAVR